MQINFYRTLTYLFIVLKAFEGKDIAVTGLVQEYRGKPQIIATEPEQIVVIE